MSKARDFAFDFDVIRGAVMLSHYQEWMTVVRHINALQKRVAELELENKELRK